MVTREELEKLLAAQKRPKKPGKDLNQLDERELELFSMLSRGYTSAQIREEMGLAPAELAELKARTCRSLSLKNEIQLLQLAAKKGRADP